MWRQQRNEGALSSLSKKRGRKAKRSVEQIELDRVVQENGRLRERLRRARSCANGRNSIGSAGASLARL